MIIISKQNLCVNFQLDVVSSSPTSSVMEECQGNVENWCSCSNCTTMGRHRECICCNELHQCLERCNDAIIHYKKDTAFNCIKEHPGFVANCLTWEVINVAWLAYKQQYGHWTDSLWKLKHTQRKEVYRLSSISPILVWCCWKTKPLYTTILHSQGYQRSISSRTEWAIHWLYACWWLKRH